MVSLAESQLQQAFVRNDRYSGTILPFLTLLIGLCFVALLTRPWQAPPSNWVLQSPAIQDPAINLGFTPLRSRFAVGNPTFFGFGSRLDPSRHRKTISMRDSQSESPVDARYGPRPPQDFYELLNVRMDATPEDIKKQYRRLSKKCHPDIAGEAGIDTCILVSSAYKTLMDPIQRSHYNMELKDWKLPFFRKIYWEVIHGYEGKPLSKWEDGHNRTDDQSAVFVDESKCVGCTMCVNVAPDTFGLEDTWGRAQVHTQWGNHEEDIDAAMQACPIGCIHYVKREQLPILEWCMSKTKRSIVAISEKGHEGEDPFDIAKMFITHNGAERAKSSRGRINQFTFGAEMRQAWNQLKDKTKEAWTRNKVNQALEHAHERIFQ